MKRPDPAIIPPATSKQEYPLINPGFEVIDIKAQEAIDSYLKSARYESVEAWALDSDYEFFEGQWCNEDLIPVGDIRICLLGAINYI